MAFKHLKQYYQCWMQNIRITQISFQNETSRHKRSESDRCEADRLCTTCHEIEDEKLFLMYCLRYRTERTILMKALSLDNTSFENLDENDKLLYIFNLRNKHHLLALARFIKSSFHIHSENIISFA